ncbi:MAG: alpha/beta fold hydrolase [Hydrogenophaga sp.]|uniref:alpha/beta fold hydrolase n=1 Tax=Hydrogenophaga sp. TaxID=1904254 RepID=UPI003D9B9375
MQRIEIDGIQLETAHIPGPPGRAPLLFLHEGLGSVAMWPQRGRHWPQELCAATGRAGWLYSRRGYGQSDPVADVRGAPRHDGAWHIGRHEPDYMHIEAQRVLPRLLQGLGIERPVLIGHSDGATIALLHASQHPVSACVAIAPHVWVEDVALQAITAARDLYLASAATDTDGKGLRQRLARYHADVDNAFWQWNDVWLSPAFRAFDIRPDCRRIQAPLLAVQGGGDEYGTLEQLREIAKAAPHARTVAIPHCGHSPHRDQPDALTAAIAPFLSVLP